MDFAVCPQTCCAREILVPHKDLSAVLRALSCPRSATLPAPALGLQLVSLSAAGSPSLAPLAKGSVIFPSLPKGELRDARDAEQVGV